MCVSVNAIQWRACVQSSAFWADRYFIVQIVTLEIVHSREGISFLWGQWYEATFDIRQQCKQGCQHGMQKDNMRCRDKENTDSTLQDPSPYITYFVKESLFFNGKMLCTYFAHSLFLKRNTIQAFLSRNVCMLFLNVQKDE